MCVHVYVIHQCASIVLVEPVQLRLRMSWDITEHRHTLAHQHTQQLVWYKHLRGLWNEMSPSAQTPENLTKQIISKNSVQLTINVKHNGGAALCNLVGGSADIFSKVRPGNRRYHQLAAVWVIVMMRRVKRCRPEWRKQSEMYYELRPHNPSIICAYNLMGDKTRRETMPQNNNKADEEISLHPAAGSQTRFHTTLARPIVRGTCVCINIQLMSLMTDFLVSNSAMCCRTVSHQTVMRCASIERTIVETVSFVLHMDTGIWWCFMKIFIDQLWTSQDLHGPCDVGCRQTIYQTNQGNVGLWTSQNLLLLFFQIHSRRNCTISSCVNTTWNKTHFKFNTLGPLNFNLWHKTDHWRPQRQGAA